MNYSGFVIGAGAFVIIGILHPVVIETEYHFGAKAWPMFLLLGILCVCCGFLCDHAIPGALLSVLGFSLLWSIRELFEQEKRVAKGWFPRNPTKH